jgi:tRNA modification GTPase
VTDSIFALATAPGRAAVAVVRLSGPASGAAVEALAGRRPLPRKASLMTLRRPVDRAVLDRALVLWFPGPGSYTGEDAAELHLHGGHAVIDGVIDVLLGLGLRLAEPGEFTRRAFQNGKLDLSQAEAVADLVDAETEAQRRQALGQLEGDLARRHAAWRTALIEALAVLEAAVDFPDEEVPENVADEAAPALAIIADELAAALADAHRGEQVRDGYSIALIGAPNAGKSSLLNALIARDAAIVTATPGTTRDVIEAPLNLAGFRVLIADTAGLRSSDDVIEAEGARRALARAESSALRLWVVDGAANGEGWRQPAAAVRDGDICIINKQDLRPGAASAAARDWAQSRGLEVITLSLTRDPAAAALKARLTQRVIAALSGAEFPAATRARHRHDLGEARGHLVRALHALTAPIEVELAAEDVRLASRSLAKVAGRIDPEDVLDRVFARFCIGK